jgi:predicted regulator of Ras-like GTPase activity (Roadblock/LC7/MglB family)
MVNAEPNTQVQSLIAGLNGRHGILGCLLVAGDGGVVASSLPNDIDVATLGSLSATLYSNNDVSIRRMKRGNLRQMTLLTEKGILHFYQIGEYYLVVLTARGQKVNLEGLIKAVEEQGTNLGQILV